MELIDVVNKLVGPIEPVGETHTDNDRFNNLETMIELMKSLHMQVDDIEINNRDRHEYSMKRAAGLANAYLNWLGIPD